MTKRNYTLLHLFLAALIVGLSACSASQTRSSAAGGAAEVQSITITDTLELSGNLGAEQISALTWGTSGLVESVNVSVGSQVKKGDVLAVLKADTLPASILEAQAELTTAQYELSEIVSSTLTYTEAQLAVLEARKNVEEAQNNYDALNYPRASDTLIKNTEAKILEAQKTLTLATREYKESQNAPDGDAEKTANTLAMTEAQMALTELQSTLNWYLAKPTEDDYEEAKLNLEAARAALEEARRKRDRVKNGADPLEIAAAEAAVASAQAKVDAKFIIAPFDGEVIAIYSPVNSTVSSGTSAIGLVNRSTMKVETSVDETNIAQVSVGDIAEITMDSLAEEKLTGKVTLIDPIGKTVSGLVKYTVIIAVDETDAPVLFGASATVTLFTSEPRTSLAVPISAVQTDNRGEYLLRVKEDGTTERIEIQSGDLSGNLVTISAVGNLQAGDKVQTGAAADAASDDSSESQRDPGGMPPGGGFGIGG